MFALISARSALFALISLGVSLSGCKDKPPPQEASVAPDKPAPTPSASVVAPPAPSASAVAPTPTFAPRPTNGPRFIVRHEVPQYSYITWHNAAAVVCTGHDCLYDAEMVTEKGLVDTMNPTGVMELHHPRAFRDQAQNRIVYEGEYPTICAEFQHWMDRSDSFSVSWKRTGKSWSEGRCDFGPKYEDEPLPRPPRELDDALLHAPIANAAKTIIHGAGAPPLLVMEDSVYTWDGKTWTKHELPWKKFPPKSDYNGSALSQRPVRLANGSTLFPRGGYFVDSKGEFGALQIISAKNEVLTDIDVHGIIWAKKHPWALVEMGKSLLLTTPEESAKAFFVHATIPTRTAAVKPPAPLATIAPPSAPASASAAPSAAASALAASSAAAPPEPALSASAASGAEAPPAPIAPSNGLSELKAFSADCTTPFVLLASPPRPGQEYATTRAGLKGHSELQDIVTFVEVVINGQTFFGVQTKNEADAHQFMEVVEKNIKGMKPSLRCLDVLSRIPDRYAPPEGMRIVGINLTTGELIPFD